MEAILIYALLTSSAFYLGSRAVITRPIWSRYPRWLASFMDCAACSGFWYGLGFSLLARSLGPFGPNSLVGPFGPSILGSVLTGLCATVWTPIMAGYMQLGFEHLGSAVEEDDNGRG